MKPPKKVPRPNTPDTDLPNRHPDDGTVPRRESPDSGQPGRHPDTPTAGGPSGSHRPVGDADNLPREPQVEVADLPPVEQPGTSVTGAASDISFLSAFLVRDLPAPLADGLRYGKRQTIYAEIENEGITLVRRGDDGQYRATSLNELNASGPVLERVGATDFWRRKGADEQPGPSHRPRPDDDAGQPSGEAALANDLLADNLFPLDLSPALWRNWGTSTKPLTGESVEIKGLHYRVVPNGSPQTYRIAYLEHPRFSPSRYEAFEQMLLIEPALQPRWAVKRNDQWVVLEHRLPFEKPLRAYVADTFRDLTQTSLTTVARNIFNRANHSEVIDSRGLAVLKQTFRHWADARSARTTQQELADPLLMLLIVPRAINNTWMAVTPAEPSGALRRLDFDPQRFQGLWNHYAGDPSNFNLKQLVGTVLVRNGYDVFPLANEHQGPTLVFTRANHDYVFFLKLGRVNGENIRQIVHPGAELADPHLAARIGEAAQTRLRAAYDQDKVVWLLGGTQKTASGIESVFIIREG